jgi:hypothetical protein
MPPYHRMLRSIGGRLGAHTDPIDFVLNARAALILVQRHKIPSRRPAREPVIRANQSEDQKSPL